MEQIVCIFLLGAIVWFALAFLPALIFTLRDIDEDE